MNVSAKFNGRYYFSHHCAALFLNYNEVCKDIFLCQWSRNVHNRSLETEHPVIMRCESESRIDLSQYTCVPACQQLSSTIWLPSGYKHTHTHTLLSLPKSLWVFCLCLLGPHLGPQQAPSLCTARHGTAPDLTDLLKLRPALQRCSSSAHQHLRYHRFVLLGCFLPWNRSCGELPVCCLPEPLSVYR